MSWRTFSVMALAGLLLSARGLAEDVERVTLSEAEKGLLGAINKERRANGAEELQPHGKLMTAARLHARNMAAADTGVHVLKDVRPEWRGPEDRLEHVGYRGFAWGENVAWGYARPEKVAAGWMESEPHRRNMLNADFQEIGLGAVRGTSGLYWCAVFGRSSPLPSRPDTTGPAEERGERQAAPNVAPASSQAWRYRWHNGHWWYWLPRGQWAVWVDGRWVEKQ